MQRAQPVLLAHHLLAHGWALARDVDRLVDCRRRLDVSPLAPGALAGSSLPLDPDGVAADLGFAVRFENSLDAVSDRDFVAEALFALALLGVHLSRIGEEVVLWSTDEFAFVRLADAYATGMLDAAAEEEPRHRRAGRGKAGRLIGDLTGLLATLKGLPLAYNRDLQEDKEPLFDAVDQISLGLPALTGLRDPRFDTDRMQAAADSPYSAATDLAECSSRKACPSAMRTRSSAARAGLGRAPRAARRARRGPPDLGGERGRAAGARRRGDAPHDAGRRGTGTGQQAARRFRKRRARRRARSG